MKKTIIVLALALGALTGFSQARFNSRITPTLSLSSKDSLQLDGSLSTPVPGNGPIKTYVWRQVAGPRNGSRIRTSRAVKSWVRFLVIGTYKFELLITDSIGKTGRDTTTAIIRP